MLNDLDGQIICPEPNINLKKHGNKSSDCPRMVKTEEKKTNKSNRK